MKWEELSTFDRSLITMRGDTALYPPAFITSTVSAMQKARRFAITDRASERVREALVRYPELLVQNSEFAIPAFPTMWIEFNSRVLLGDETLSGQSRNATDLRVGYLIENNHVQVFAEGNDHRPMYMYIGYDLNRPMSQPEQQQVAHDFGVSRIGLDPFLWGHTLHETLSPENRRGLRDRHAIAIPSVLRSWLAQRDNLLQDMMEKSYYGSAGELRNILAILLMLNQPAEVHTVRDVPRKRGLIRGKPQPYFGYSVVDIDLDKKSKINLLSRPRKGHHTSPRWHEVRGHFCHNEAARRADHDHDWQETDPRKWQCGKGCGGKRWWRELPNGRGSAQTGFVYQERRIKTRADKGQAAHSALAEQTA